MIKLELDLALDAGIVERGDFTNEYVDAVEALIDLEAIRKAALKVIVDPMYGVGQLTLGTVLTEARCRVTFIHERHNPLFGGRSPAPNPEALRLLSSHACAKTATISGWPWTATPTASPSSTSAANTFRSTTFCCCSIGTCTKCAANAAAWCAICPPRICSTAWRTRLGEECYEVPVGFKHIVQRMVEHNAVLGGESSGGLTIRGHILGKDGIFASALVVEMLARTGKKISQLLRARLRA